ncbi:MAG: HD domain-containing protein [Candidatus Firestonebacteria bacterium]|nr:HD domain-containing protein [Candidatus Firestonebacteria bacterium]
MCLYRTSREAWEWATLAPYATKSDDRRFSWRYTDNIKLKDIYTRFPSEKTNDPIDQSGSKSRYKTAFQIDKERIIESQAFRRLEYKTQIFVSHEGDHFRTRLTHTLEVAAISRAVANALRLNEDLCEAISLAHDLGHTL